MQIKKQVSGMQIKKQVSRMQIKKQVSRMLIKKHVFRMQQDVLSAVRMQSGANGCGLRKGSFTPRRCHP